MQKKTPDFVAALSYVVATSLQWSLILGFLHLFQLHGLENLPELVAALPTQVAAYLPSLETISTSLVGAFTFFMALRSRVFSPLDNSRPSPTASDPVFKERRRPWWTPPPLAFPLIWTTIAFLRSISTAMVFRSTGTLLCLPIFAFFGHLSIGDTWNTINNVEKRLGTATLGVFFVWASAVYTTLLYYETLPLAGKVLAPSCAWLTVAMFLVYSIWRLNRCVGEGEAQGEVMVGEGEAQGEVMVGEGEAQGEVLACASFALPSNRAFSRTRSPVCPHTPPAHPYVPLPLPLTHMSPSASAACICPSGSRCSRRWRRGRAARGACPSRPSRSDCARRPAPRGAGVGAGAGTAVGGMAGRGGTLVAAPFVRERGPTKW